MTNVKLYKFLLSLKKCFFPAMLACFFSMSLHAQNPALKPVRLQLKWTHAFQFAGYYAALENGYYRDAGLEVEILAGGPTMDVVTQVVSGQADFGVGTSGLLLDYAAGKPIKVLGVKYFMLSPRTYGIDFYGDNFFTSRKMFQKNEALVNAFCAATVRGWKDALENPEGVIDLILKKYPTEMSRDHLRYEAERTVDLMTNLVSPGYMLRGRWEHIADTYIELGMLKKRPDLDDFLLLPDSLMLPAWFKDAVLGMGLVFFVMLTILLYLRNRNLKLKHRFAEQTVQEEQREREERLKRVELQKVLVRDIHDGLGGIAANISFTAVLARNEVDVTSKDKWLDKLERLAREVNMEVRDLMNSLDASTIQWPDLIDSVRRRSDLLFDGKKTMVDFQIEGEPVAEDIGLVEGLSLIRIAGEGMNNVIKYAGRCSYDSENSP
ncbi:MAG: ABC transporter substrate-binding protein [Kiritimatiellae bacterium]|jgi:ABC-type nitrate/sulfonate/bicarbonate transport system substrate-binding protein/Na+-transporting methylmalonyl-CoA/oxaloacetate decarboxylase gamma subunit|nr:ABC transporter substrate-binding protein [Kiritimatiellia bacterium]